MFGNWIPKIERIVQLKIANQQTFILFTYLFMNVT